MFESLEVASDLKPVDLSVLTCKMGIVIGPIFWVVEEI